MTMPAPQGPRGPVASRAPLQPLPHTPRPLGAVRARGWLARQLQRQADGLTGHAEQVLPDLGPESAWRGGPGEDWEKGPYYLRGLVSLADEGLRAQARPWIEWLLDHKREDGQIGPASNPDWWPRMVACWVLRDHHGATGDPRAIEALTRYARYLQANLPSRPLSEWAKARAADQVEVLYWLYNRTGEAFLLELGDRLREQANDWLGFFGSLQPAEGDYHPDHAVNVSQAMEYPAVAFKRSGRPSDLALVATGYRLPREAHGLPFGLWSGTEGLASRSNSQGVETCSIVEQILSNIIAFEALLDVGLADEHERLAYNLLPGATTKEFRQFQDYTLPDLPVAKANPPGSLPFRDDHGDDLLCSPHSGFHCCCYNLHMGWPKFVQGSWMATADGGSWRWPTARPR